ncbi:hypothetical protein FRC17_005289, partial [Serendipita sp. 399]
EFFTSCLAVAAQQAANKSPVSPTTTTTTTTTFSDLDLANGIPKVTPSRSYPGAISDFYGLPTNPICIYRTGDEWPVRKGPEAQRVLREARPSTIDPIRFAEEGKEAGSLYLWVGVVTRSLSFEDAKAAAIGCKKILADAQFPEIEIASRESVFTRSTAGPRLLDHDPFLDPIADVRSPFTPSLGIQIAPRNAPHFEGTGALYLCESSQSDRVFLLTTRHVVLSPSTHSSQLYSRKNSSQPRLEVVILGSKAYDDAYNGMLGKIGHEILFVQMYKGNLDTLGEAVEGEKTQVTNMRQDLHSKLATANQTIIDIKQLLDEINSHWNMLSQRVLGYILHTPPLSVATGPKQFTEDWALIDLDRDKIDWDTFKGNVVYLGNKISGPDFVLKMHPHPRCQSDFKYPVGGLLQVKGIVKEAEIRNPKQLDANVEECLLAVKNGKTTGVTMGRETGIESIIREYDEDGIKRTSMEVAVYPYSHRDGASSAPGDSGSIVIDGQGRIVGLLTGGSGTTEFTDVTYVTPYFWLEERIKMAFPNSYLYPVVNY